VVICQFRSDHDLEILKVFNSMPNGLLFSHPTGSANARAALAGLTEAGLLEKFCTTIAAYPGNVWGRLAQTRLGREFERRRYEDHLASKTLQHPWRELGRMLATRLRMSSLIRHETGTFCIDAIYRAQDRLAAGFLRSYPRNFSGVYTFEDGALETLAAARELGLAGIYELPIGYWRSARELLKPEFDRMPNWSATLTGFKDSDAKLARKDAELARATKIILASSFTAHTLKSYQGKLAPTFVVPYGFPDVRPDNNTPAKSRNHSSPLRLLYVGSLSQRKGIGDVFAAVNQLQSAVTLTVIGNKVTTDCPALDRELAKHRWIPSLAHDKVLEQMRAHDVLVFPSLFEGFGLVITEAMSQGMPVVTTERTAGPDFINHGENGWLIKAGSTSELTQQLEALVRDRRSVDDAGQCARQTAATRPWSVYGLELANAVTAS